MKKKILVTGAGGYIGRHVITALCDLGAEVIGVGRHLESLDPRAKIIRQNILDGDKDCFNKLGRPDACLHMAWENGFCHNSDAHMGNLSAHYRFIRDMTDGGLTQLAVMGTMHEIGYWEGPVDENTPCNPLSQYGIAKDALRRSVFQMLDGKNVCLQWLRAYYIYGDDQNAHSIFGKLLQAAKEGKTHFPFTSGKNLYDFIPVKELARQIAACVMQTEVNGIINCCTGKPVSLGDMIESYIKQNNLNINLDYGAFPDRPYDSPGIWGDPQKIKQIMRQHEIDY